MQDMFPLLLSRDEHEFFCFSPNFTYKNLFAEFTDPQKTVLGSEDSSQFDQGRACFGGQLSYVL